MSTYTQIIYQIVFGTKGHEKTLVKEYRKELYQYTWGILQNKECHLYQINGIEDHIHILTDIHSSVSLSTLVKDIKLASSKFIKAKQLFPSFNGWQDGYGAFTYSVREKDTLIQYIKNQEEHHAKKTFREEFIELLNEHGIVFNEKYLL